MHDVEAIASCEDISFDASAKLGLHRCYIVGDDPLRAANSHSHTHLHAKLILTAHARVIGCEGSNHDEALFEANHD